MSEFKGTNGIWFLSGTEIVSMPSQTKICKVNGKTYEEAKANALLISFAPEMLEMLKKVVSEFSHYKEKAQGTSKCWAIIEAEELITQITQP
jgi:hypothetical protein